MERKNKVKARIKKSTNMRTNFLKCLLFSSTAHITHAQCDLKEYTRIFNEANVFQEKHKFIDAKNRYEAAKIYACNQEEKDLVDVRIDALFGLADRALQKADKIIDAFYFYDDRFALAYKYNRFYFIDKNGDEVTQLGKWKKAEQFDDTGFAKVQMDENEKLISFLLDIYGNTYPAAYDSQDIGELITALDLSEKHLTVIPDNIFKHLPLKFLFLVGNQISSLPSEIGRLENLTELHLNNNSLSDLPTTIGELKKLKKLLLYANLITSLPNTIGKMENLSELYLQGNYLNRLPDAIWDLENLTYLALDANGISNLPPLIGRMKNLKSLSLGSNLLSNLPTEIGQLKNLEYLDLSNNQLDSLPPEIKQLKNLGFMYLTGNPIPEAEQGRIQQLLPMCNIEF